MIWRQPFLPRTRLSSRTHRAVKWLPSSRIRKRPLLHPRHRVLEEEEAEYPAPEGEEVAYQRVVVRHEDPEAEAALLEALLAEAVECDDKEEERSATMIPPGALCCTVLQT
jgi:hypothetical protein